MKRREAHAERVHENRGACLADCQGHCIQVTIYGEEDPKGLYRSS